MIHFFRDANAVGVDSRFVTKKRGSVFFVLCALHQNETAMLKNAGAGQRSTSNEL